MGKIYIIKQEGGCTKITTTNAKGGGESNECIKTTRVIVFFCCRVLHRSRERKGKTSWEPGTNFFVRFIAQRGRRVQHTQLLLFDCGLLNLFHVKYIGNFYFKWFTRNATAVDELWKRTTTVFSYSYYIRRKGSWIYRRGSPRSFSVLLFPGEQFQSPLHFEAESNADTRDRKNYFSHLPFLFKKCSIITLD
jgi:hypothetical protein